MEFVRFQITILFFITIIVSTSYSRQYVPWTFAERINKSDDIGWGYVSYIGDTSIIEILEVYKGNLPDKIILPYKYHGKLNEQVGYFNFSHKVDHVSRVSSIEKDSPQYNILQMAKDPALILNHEKLFSSPDVVELIGYSFESFNIQCDKIPGMKKRVSLRDYEDIPWDYKTIFSIICQVDTLKKKLRIKSINPETNISRKLKFLIEHIYLNGLLPDSVKSEEIEIHVDTRDIQIASTIDREMARSIVINGLQSNNKELIFASIIAWARMRDLELIPCVTPLLDYTKEVPFKHYIQVFNTAVKYLGYSNNEDIIEPMLSRLNSLDLTYQTERSLASELYEGLSDFITPEVKKALEFGALNNYESAYTGLKLSGDEKSFDIIIQSFKRNPKYYLAACNTLHLLILRSNKVEESWMDITSSAVAKKTSGRWIRWWRRNKSDFRIVKSFDQVINEIYK